MQFAGGVKDTAELCKLFNWRDGTFILRVRFGEKKSRIRETPTLSTDADSRTNKILKRFRD
jgi:hypothetical protein